MFSIPPNGFKTEENLEGRRHCILVAASNPFPLPVPVYRPNFDNCGDPSSCHDAETVAGWFSRCSVSLSVICPWKLPKIRALYEMGKRNPNSEDPHVQHQHPDFLVLISEDFKEALAALNLEMLAGNRDAFSPSHPDSGASATHEPVNLPVSKSLQNSSGNIPLCLGMEPAAMKYSAPISSPSAPSTPDAAATLSMLDSQTSSPSLVSQDLVKNNENMQHPGVDMSPSLSVILNNVPDIIPVRGSFPSAFRDLASLGFQSTAQITLIEDCSHMISKGTSVTVPLTQTVLSSEKAGSSTVFGSQAEAGTSQHVKNSSVDSSLATKSETKVAVLGLLRPLSNLEGSSTVVVGQIESSLNQVEGSLSMNTVSSTDVASSTKIPVLGLPQQLHVGEQSDCLYCSAVSTPVSQEPGCLPTVKSKYVKVWEGNLFRLKQGNSIFITLLEAYRKASASATLAVDWPDSIQVVRVISQDHVNQEFDVGRAVLLVFRVVNQHAFIGQLLEKKLCAVVELPDEILLLSVSDKPTRLIGMLFPKDAQISTSGASVAAVAAAEDQQD